MKVFVLGIGKTGSQVVELIEKSPDIELVGAFNRKNLNWNLMSTADVGIVFLPGPGFEESFQELIQLKLPLVVGSTGFNWTVGMRNSLLKQEVKLVHGRNFSLGMNFIRHCLSQVNHFKKLFPNIRYGMTETHHTKKIDAPSGTALAWREWSEQNFDIESVRTGDVIGEHEFILETDVEKITLKHESKDRSLFAQGAIWSARQLIKKNSLNYGVTVFEDQVDLYIKEETE